MYTSAEDYGFRRCTGVDENGDFVFTRGSAQAGDILGEWIVEDVLSAMRVPFCTYEKATESDSIYTVQRVFKSIPMFDGLGWQATPPFHPEVYPLRYAYALAIATTSNWTVYGATNVRGYSSLGEQYLEVLEGAEWGYPSIFCRVRLSSYETTATRSVPVKYQGIFDRCTAVITTGFANGYSASDLTGTFSAAGVVTLPANFSLGGVWPPRNIGPLDFDPNTQDWSFVSAYAHIDVLGVFVHWNFTNT